jgi:hypothetical protein|tara:strand:- start:1513 stop:2103 length:591 start_codon:yes stop_codon:yes gene_type:complete
MTEVIFISETRLRQFTDMNNNLSSELIKNAIREAQDIQIQRILGTKLYNRLIAGVDAADLTTNETALLNDYIADALIYWSYYYSLDAIYLRPRNNGLARPDGGENSVDADLIYYDRKRNTVRKKAEWYSELLATYLQEENALFPELNESTKLYEKSSDTNSQYANNPFVMRDTSRGQGRVFGIPTVDGAYPYEPNR